MKQSSHQCVNCQLSFPIESDYLAHYHSEIHRYNIKRKLIGLQPLTQNQYALQFSEDKSSKNSATQEFYCEICSKKFMSMGTYKQHLSSKRHHLKREELKTPGKLMSKSSSLSSFEVVGAQKSIQCLFCQQQSSHSHLQQKHNFPPFEQQCVNIEGLMSLVKEKIQNFTCIYCNHKFASEESVRQHINDVSHCKLDLNNFEEYEKFYLWKIEEQSQAEDADNEQNKNQQIEKKHLTLKQVEQQIQNRIQLTSTGAIINGKQVGFRHLKKYYKQYLNREIINYREKYQLAIGSEKSEWKTCSTYGQKGPKICFITSCR